MGVLTRGGWRIAHADNRAQAGAARGIRMGACAVTRPRVVVVDVPDTAEARSGHNAFGVLLTQYTQM